ncbi:MAG: response regulator [Zavarzinella sp.]|nr:response regulator [Zavarzinella sp.]
MPTAQDFAPAEVRPGDRLRPYDPEPSGDSPTREIRPPLRGTEVVLVVDDERGVRALSGHILRTYGYTVLEARGAEAAVRRASEYPGPIHLLLTDVSLSGECGRALATALTVMQPGLRVLFMSGLSDVAVAPAAQEPGNFLAKPFTVFGLAAKVRRVLDAA